MVMAREGSRCLGRELEPGSSARLDFKFLLHRVYIHKYICKARQGGLGSTSITLYMHMCHLNLQQTIDQFMRPGGRADSKLNTELMNSINTVFEKALYMFSLALTRAVLTNLKLWDNLHVGAVSRHKLDSLNTSNDLFKKN